MQLTSMGFRIICGRSEFLFNPDNLDSELLWAANNPFMPEGWAFGQFLIEPSKLTMSGYENGAFWLRDKCRFSGLLVELQNKMEEDRDLLGYRYQYSFKGNSAHDQPVSSGCSGFKVGDYYGAIKSYPRQFLTLQLSEVAPSGRGRPVQFVDMRNCQPIETDWGLLSAHRKKNDMTLFAHCDNLASFLRKNNAEKVRIEPLWQVPR